MRRVASKSKSAIKSPRRAVRRRVPKSANPKVMKFAGMLSNEEAKEMLRFIDEEFEQVED